MSALWCPLPTPTILFGFLLPWAWGVSSRLLQQSAATVPYLGRGISLYYCRSWPSTWDSSSRPSRLLPLTNVIQLGSVKKCNKKVLVSQSCLTLCYLMNCSSSGFSVHEFSRQEYWSVLLCLFKDLPGSGTEPGSSALQTDSLQSEPMEKPDI